MIGIDELKERIKSWENDLFDEEKPENTIKQYLKGLDHFTTYLEEAGITTIDKKAVIGFKDALKSKIGSNPDGRAPNKGISAVSTINLYLVALNKFFSDNALEELKVKPLKTITSNVANDVITEKEYKRLIEWADKLGDTRTRLIMEVLAFTGLRISELKFLTVETLKNREMTVTNKGKTRLVFIPRELTKKLKQYCKENGIKHGIIFHGYKWVEVDGKKELQPDYTKMLSNVTISKNMKQIAGKARGIRLNKIHPHTFRHFFAKRYAKIPGGNPHVLPLIMGHKPDQAMTALYVMPSRDDLKDIMDDMEKYYTPKKKRGRKKKTPTK